MSSRSILPKLRTLAGVGPKRQALVAEAIVRMLAARIDILLRPFNRVSKRFGAFLPPSDPRVSDRPPATIDETRLARDVSWAIAAAAPFMPFRAVCLQQAMAAQRMLQRRGVHSAMHFGAGRSSERPIDAHCWLDTGGVKVTGYPIAGNLREIGCFV